MASGRLHHHLADQVVQQDESQHLFLDTLDRLGRDRVHAQRPFQITKVHFDLPALAVEVNQFLGRVFLGIQQRDDDPGPVGAKAFAADAKGYLPQREGLIGNRRPAFLAEPFGAPRGGPGNQGILFSQPFFQSARALAAVEDNLPAGQAEAAVKTLGHEQSHMGEAH